MISSVEELFLEGEYVLTKEYDDHKEDIQKLSGILFSCVSCGMKFYAIKSSARYCKKCKVERRNERARKFYRKKFGGIPQKGRECNKCGVIYDAIGANSMYCREHTKAYKKRTRSFEICQLDGCESPLEGKRSHAKYCCDKHQGESRDKNRNRAKPRQYNNCQLEGCENSLEGKRSNAKYCCREHLKSVYEKSPKRKAYNKRRRKKHRGRNKEYEKKWKLIRNKVRQVIEHET